MRCSDESWNFLNATHGYVRRICPEFLSGEFVRSFCPEYLSGVLSGIFVRSFCPEDLSGVFVRNICPEYLSGVFVRSSLAQAYKYEMEQRMQSAVHYHARLQREKTSESLAIESRYSALEEMRCVKSKLK